MNEKQINEIQKAKTDKKKKIKALKLFTIRVERCLHDQPR